MGEKIDYRIKHIGINCGNDMQAQQLLGQLIQFFGVERGREDQAKVFAGNIFELMKSSDVGTYGHIALQTNDVELAMKDLAERGITFREETIRKNEEGKFIFAYLTQEFGGFAFHLTT